MFIFKALAKASLACALMTVNPTFGKPTNEAISKTVSSTISKRMELTEIDSYLAASEEQFSDIVDGTAKSVRWFNGVASTEIALVYLHGFSASAREISPVTEQLADVLQANIYYARLAGHGRSAEAMTEASVEQWYLDTLEAWQIGRVIGKEVVVISVSTGGTLATWLAAQPAAETMKANILISPNFGIASRSGEIVRWGWGFKLAKWLNGPYREFTPQNELHKKYWTERYPIEAIIPMVKLVDRVVEQDHSVTRTPHLMVYSPADKIIRVDRIHSIAKQMTSASVTLSPFRNSTDPYQHVLAGDACSPQTTDEVVALLKTYIEGLSS